MRISWGASAAAIVLAISGTAGAQAPIPNDRAIDVQTFEYAIGPKTFFTVPDADVAANKQLAVDVLVTYLTKPFKIYNVDPEHPDQIGPERTTVIESLAAGQITAALGIGDRFQIGANLPIVFALSGDGLMAETGNASCAMPPCLNVSGLGDLLVEGKYRLYKQGSIRIAGLAGVTLPTSVGSGGAEFIGDDLPTARARVALQLDPSTKVSLGVSGGAVLRKPRTIYDSTIGPQLVWGAGAALRVTDRFSVIAESYGRAGFDFSLDSSPLEVQGGVRVYATSAVAVVAGGGAGVIRGIGAPEARFFLSVGYAPDVRDSDADGIANGRDRCVLEAEDKDGHADGDGCPDADNDGDNRDDPVDKCPIEPEDFDGFDDDDGCPERDNDRDGFPDLEDKCPTAPEDGKEPGTKDGCPAGERDSDADGLNDAVDKCPLEEEDLDGFEDGDGCREPDNDKDGVNDDIDKCSLCPEDKDGFGDVDGCPDTDNDKDGVPDATDRCPLEAETVNGVKDGDGCADTGGRRVVRLDGDRLRIDRVPTLARGRLSPAGMLIVDQMALVMIGQHDITKWLIALAQRRDADAQTLAKAIEARLIAKGVPADRFSVIAAAGTPKIGGVVQERRDPEVPVCPLSLQVKQRPEAILRPKGEPAPAPEPEPTPEPAPAPADDDLELE